MELRTHTLWILALLLTAGCTNDTRSDAYGQFEADKLTISAELPGKLLQFSVQEGVTLLAGQKVGQIDTLGLQLKKNELIAGLELVKTKLSTLSAQEKVYKSQVETAQKNRKRIKALVADNAATEQQLDEVEGSINTLNAQVEAVRVQQRSVFAEMATIETRIAQISDQISRGTIINPINGVVINSFAEAYELVGQTTPLYQIANLDELEMRVFVSGAQLADVKLGALVEVLVDQNEEINRSLSGTVSWIASEAEFTPKMIQTKEERVTQVYAVLVRVANPDGILKIGMPGEVNF